jgi:hypothetical protein
MTEVAATMKIAYEPWMQDWPVEVSDAGRLEEFLACCEGEQRPEQSAAMAEVLLVSLDDAFKQGQPSGEIMIRSARVLRRHPELLEYWRCGSARSEEEMFAITPWLRSI